MTRFVGILSGKGGVAKTTTTVNLGAAFNYFGRDVTIVDGNLSTPNLGLHLGVPVVPISLHDVLKGKNDILESVYQHNSGLKIIPASLYVNEMDKLNDKFNLQLQSNIENQDIEIFGNNIGKNLKSETVKFSIITSTLIGVLIILSFIL